MNESIDFQTQISCPNCHNSTPASLSDMHPGVVITCAHCDEKFEFGSYDQRSNQDGIDEIR